MTFLLFPQWFAEKSVESVCEFVGKVANTVRPATQVKANYGVIVLTPLRHAHCHWQTHPGGTTSNCCFSRGFATRSAPATLLNSDPYLCGVVLN